MYFGHLQYRPGRRRNLQRGYMLVILIFLMVGLTIGMLATLPAIATAVKRDKEEEMIHRGVEYARAVKKYYKKFGRYPATIEALEDTNHMRFLRKRYKDPFGKDGKWELVRFGQVQMNAGQRGGGGGFAGGGPALPNVPGVSNMLQGTPQTGQSGVTGGFGAGSTGTSGSGSSFGQSSTGSGSSFGQSGTGSGGNFGQSTVGGSFGQTGSGSSGTGSSGSGTSGTGSSFGQTGTGGAGQVFGGGAIIGVSSSSERESLRVVADKNHYKDWKFIYDPTFDRGGLITGPYDPKKQMGQFAGSNGIGQPAGQPTGQAGTNPTGSSFGQPSSFGQGGFGQPQQPPDIPKPNPQ